jgi:hypothetical protein
MQMLFRSSDVWSTQAKPSSSQNAVDTDGSSTHAAPDISTSPRSSTCWYSWPLSSRGQAGLVSLPTSRVACCGSASGGSGIWSPTAGRKLADTRKAAAIITNYVSFRHAAHQLHTYIDGGMWSHEVYSVHNQVSGCGALLYCTVCMVHGALWCIVVHGAWWGPDPKKCSTSSRYPRKVLAF